MDEGANIDVPAEIVLNLIASGSNSGSTATLEDILRVEYGRDADANLMVALTMSILLDNRPAAHVSRNNPK